MSSLFDNPSAAFAVHQEFQPVEKEPFQIPRHYLLYASTGSFELIADDAHWLLPPDRAAWIAANVPLHVTLPTVSTCSSVLYAPDFLPAPVETCRVFAVSPLLREMILYAMRWGIDRNPDDSAADRFFLTLAHVCQEAVEDPVPFWLPTGRSEDLQNAMHYTRQHLDDDLQITEVAAHVGVSERTLARRFSEETTMTWRAYQRRARLLRAMELLAAGRLNITEVSLSVGFNSVSAFINAFQQFTGETPGQYQKRFVPS